MQNQVLQTLADGNWHSGEELAKQLSLSRTAIWKRIAQLREQGLAIEGDRGKGYRLLDRVQPYDLSAIRESLSAAALAHTGPFEVAGAIESTNLACLQKIATQSDNLSGTVLLAEQQTAGRGRRGRTWVSPPGCNIYCSLIWRFETGASSLAGLSLVVGLALAAALEKAGFPGIALKWPNDLLFRERKLAGVLIELSGDLAGACDVVIGFGVNVSMPRAARDSIDQDWTDLAGIAAGVDLDKNRLLGAMLSEIVESLLVFQARGFAAFLDAWHARDAFRGRQVVLHTGASGAQGNAVEGCYLGVNEDGSIRLETRDGVAGFSGGEISLRKV